MDYLHTHRKVQLCYTPVYNFIGLKCSFLNTRSLHKNIDNVIGNFNICASEIFFMAETRLRNTDTSNTYKIPEFKIVCRNDQAWNQEGRPPHGLIGYVKDGIQTLDVNKYSYQNFESILCVQHNS